MRAKEYKPTWTENEAMMHGGYSKAAERALERQRQDTLAVIDDPRYRRMMGYTAADALAIKAELRG